MVNKKTYEPTLDEIDECCRKIRAGWSEATYRIRAGVVTKTALKDVMSWQPTVYTEAEVEAAIGCRIHQ